MKLPVVNNEGKELRTLEVDDGVFGIEPNAAVLHQAFVAGRNNRRLGTAQTKTRGMVQGSTRKIRRQKYTGRARQGSIRAPHHVGGGVVFGPHPRDYSQALPKKMRRLAIRSALSGKVADGQLVVVDRIALEKPKTKEMARVLRNVGVERSALIVTGQPDRTVFVSARNLEKTKVLPAAYLNVVDMLNHQKLLMTEEAVRVAEGLWGRPVAAPAATAGAPPKRRRTVKAAERTAVPVAEATPKRRGVANPAAKNEAPAPVAEAKATTAEAPIPKHRARPGATSKPTAESKPPARARAKPASDTELAEGARKPRRRTRKTERGGG